MTPNKKAGLAPARKSRGFTLIEVMAVVVVIAILAAVAYPSYQDYIIRANRSAAQQLMLGIASRQEQFMLDARTYTATIGPAGLNFVQDGWDCAGTPTQCTNARYTVTSPLVVGPPAGYTITATPIGPQVRDLNDPLGSTNVVGPLTLNNLGQKAPAVKWTK